MFSQLKSIIDIIRTGVSEFRDFKTKADRKNEVLNLLKTYFLLKDCTDEGAKILREAGSDPVSTIAEMDPNTAITVLENWDVTLRKQGFRLYALQGHMLGQDHLSVLNPRLQEKIKEVVGYKMDRVVSLHGIGASLFFRNMFPIEETNEEKVRLVALMVGAEEDGIIDIDASLQEIERLNQALDDYRKLVNELVSKEELLLLSKQARSETKYEHQA
jgi:hypothetical protein